MFIGYQSAVQSKMSSLFYACNVTNSYGWEVAMADQHTPQDAPERERPRRQEEEKPQTWKHPDDGTELSERDQERQLKP